MNNALTNKTLPPAVVSLISVPPRTVSYLDIRRDTTTYPRIDAVPAEVAVAAITQIIYRATFNAAPGGFREEGGDERIATMAAELYDICLEDYDGLGTHLLSFAEIARVIRAASVKRDLYGISVRSLYDALLDYCQGEGRKASQQVKAERWAQLQAPALPAPEPTDQERKALASTIEQLTKKHQAI